MSRPLVVGAIALLTLCGSTALARGLKTSFYLERGGTRLPVTPLTEGLEAALAARKDLDFTPVAKLIAEPRAAAERKLASVAGEIAAGESLTANLEIERAVQRLSAAAAAQVELYDLWRDDPSARRRYERTLGSLSIAQFLAGKKGACRKTLLHAFIATPSLTFDTKRFPPQMKSLFEETRFLADELGKSKGKIHTRPAGATVRINGVIKGISPLSVEGLVAGRNLVTVSKLGYRSKTVTLDAAGAGQFAETEVHLQPLAGAPAQLLHEALAEAVRKAPRTALPRIAAALDRELMVLAQVTGDATAATVTLYAYLKAERRVVGVTRASIDPSLAEVQTPAVIEALMVALKRSRRPAPRQKSAPPWYSRFRRSRYFWPLLGALAGAAVVGTTVGVIAAQPRGGIDRRTRLLLPTIVGF